jgi:hypothetical protein
VGNSIESSPDTIGHCKGKGSSWLVGKGNRVQSGRGEGTKEDTCITYLDRHRRHSWMGDCFFSDLQLQHLGTLFSPPSILRHDPPCQKRSLSTSLYQLEHRWHLKKRKEKGSLRTPRIKELINWSSWVPMFFKKFPKQNFVAFLAKKLGKFSSCDILLNFFKKILACEFS